MGVAFGDVIVDGRQWLAGNVAGYSGRNRRLFNKFHVAGNVRLLFRLSGWVAAGTTDDQACGSRAGIRRAGKFYFGGFDSLSNLGQPLCLGGGAGGNWVLFLWVYVAAESWLNNDSTNDTRGQALSAYMIVQMVGIVLAQMLLLVADPSGYVLFVIPSVLVSISFAPILLSISPTPAFDSTKPMSLRDLVKISPLGCVGMFLLGGVFSAQFGMSAVYGAEVGLSVAQISMFAATFYIFATLLQYPLGWLSDRMDRRLLILLTALVAASGAFLGYFFSHNYIYLLVAAGLIGGFSNPLYSLLIAHANDYLDFDDMAAASGGLVFITGVGAIAGPVAIGWVMEQIGPHGYFGVTAFLLCAMAAYAGYRMTQRSAIAVDETASYMPLSPGASVVAVELAQEHAIDVAKEDSE